LQNGVAQALMALVVAAASAATIAVSHWTAGNVAGRFALAGVVVFAIGLAFGSARLVGVASLPVLGSALLASATGESPAWVRSIVVGCLWYVAVELAWDSIERRNGVKRSSALEFRLFNEVASVVVISLGVTVVAYAASGLDAPRTVIGQAAIVVALFAALLFATRRLTATVSPRSESSDA
jgi:hypothetical protein